MKQNFIQTLVMLSLLFISARGVLAQPSTQREGMKESSDAKNQVIEPEDSFAARRRNRKVPLPPYPKLDPKRASDPEYVAEMWWDHLGYASKEEAAKYLKAEKKVLEEDGSQLMLISPGNPDYVEDHFEMPLNEALPHCSYTPGYTYPDVCLDEKGNRIFDSEIDGQEVLDKVVKKYGKQGGKYHKMPKVKPKLSGWMSETTYEDYKK